MSVIVNDALAICQHVTRHLNEEQAVLYLQAIDGLTTEQWVFAKQFLPRVDTTRRQSKDANIRDCVRVFIDGSVEKTFAAKDLGLWPGFQQISISYTIATIQAIEQITSRLIDHNIKPKTLAQVESASVNPKTSPTDHPATTNNIALPPPSDSNTGDGEWSEVSRRKREKRQQQQQRDSSTIRRKVTWAHGSNNVSGESKRPQLQSICLAVCSGPDETADTVKRHLDRWGFAKT